MAIVRSRTIFLISTYCIVLHNRRTEGHGYLASPRSRNLFAHEEANWSNPTADDPEPEPCPQCLNQGGKSSRCGMVGFHNYDSPRNALGGLMRTNVQATYTQGQEVVMDVVLTAHHKGHFVFSACPIMHGEVPSQKCFDEHQLTFVEDLLWGGTLDPNYPERAYIAPIEVASDDPDKNEVEYSFRMRLPSDLYGDLVLIQWYYNTANSCIHEGYMEYDWPWDYRFNTGVISSPQCGIGSAEQFWNCAEVKIQGKNCGRNCAYASPNVQEKPEVNKNDENQPEKEKEKRPRKRRSNGKKKRKSKKRQRQKHKNESSNDKRSRPGRKNRPRRRNRPRNRDVDGHRPKAAN